MTDAYFLIGTIEFMNLIIIFYNDSPFYTSLVGTVKGASNKKDMITNSVLEYRRNRKCRRFIYAWDFMDTDFL